MLGNDEPEALRARQTLKVDGIQTQGLLRNCYESDPKHLINVVETYFKMSRSMEPNSYLQVLTNAVYSTSKAREVRNTIE